MANQTQVTPKNVAIAVIVILLIAALGTWFYIASQGGGGTAQPVAITPTNTETTNTNASTNVPANTNSKTLAAEGVKYQALVDQYEGKRLQFDNCVTATPLVSATYKNGTKVMLDNRSSEPQTIMLDGKKYPIQANNYTFVTLSYTNLPHTVSVDCVMNDQPQYNIGQLIIQK